MVRNQKSPRGLATTTRDGRSGAAGGGPARAVADDAARETCCTLGRALIPSGTLTVNTPGRYRHDDMAPGTGKRNPGWTDLEHVLWAVRTRQAAGHAAADIERAVETYFDVRKRMAIAECRRAEETLPPVIALELADLREQTEGDLAVRAYLSEPASSPRKAALLEIALRELSEHQAAMARLQDGLTRDRVLALHAARPRPLPD